MKTIVKLSDSLQSLFLANEKLKKKHRKIEIFKCQKDNQEIFYLFEAEIGNFCDFYSRFVFHPRLFELNIFFQKIIYSDFVRTSIETDYRLEKTTSLLNLKENKLF